MREFDKDPEERKRRSERAKKQWQNPEFRKSQSERNAGKNNPNYGKRYKRPPRDPEWCKKISEGHKGLKHSLETRLKMSESQLGEKAKLWKGGLSYGKYCKKAKPAYNEYAHSLVGHVYFVGNPNNMKN